MEKKKKKKNCQAVWIPVILYRFAISINRTMRWAGGAKAAQAKITAGNLFARSRHRRAGVSCVEARTLPSPVLAGLGRSN